MGCGGVVKPCGSFQWQGRLYLTLAAKNLNNGKNLPRGMRKIRDLTIAAVKLNNRKKLAAGNYKGSFPRDSSTTLGMTGRVYCLTIAAGKLNYKITPNAVN